MVTTAILSEHPVSETMRATILDCLLEVKMRAGEGATSPRWEGIHAFVLAELEAAQAHAPKTARKQSAADLDEFLRDAVKADTHRI
jgi:uncharacterized protein